MSVNKYLKNQIKEILSSREAVADFLSSIGYGITSKYTFEDDKSFSIAPNGYLKDFGNGSGFGGGDVLDYLMFKDNISLPNAIEFIANKLNISNDETTAPRVYTQPIKKKVDKEPYELQLQKSKRLEQELKQHLKKGCFRGYPGTKLLKLNDTKLFQRDTIDLSFYWKLIYLNKYILAYDEKYQCTKIILRDSKKNIVDMINYRPKSNKEKPIKYYQLPNSKKPIKRGDYFLYPFQYENEELLKKNDYIFIGEGLKNSINALLYSIPYLSIESVSNSFSDKLISYINNLKLEGVELLGAFDGDEAGQAAYKRFCQNVIKIDNLFSFDSGTDFTDYIIKKVDNV
ncbi:hypothetical protein [Arcobacter peruensis]|uniref:hypothetical protein n=1 Tax=Arcobacter peruensis TaxID=2320140 RepID=UPI000F0824B0|nr:hypothetical protein [Arcobacter peruensis]